MIDQLTSTTACPLTQTYQSVLAVLRSKRKVKGIKLEISSKFWGEAYAADTEEPKCKGVIDRWADKDKTALMIRWDGYNRCQRAPLDLMDKATDGDSLNLLLLPGADGKLPEIEVVEEEPPAAETVESQDEEMPDMPAVDESAMSIQKDGVTWRVIGPNGVNADAREGPRFKPQLNSGGVALDSIEALFMFLLPPKWIDLILEHTNPLLDERDPVHAKLTRGELIRFMGYMISLSVHSVWRRCGRRSPCPIRARRRRPSGASASQSTASTRSARCSAARLRALRRRGVRRERVVLRRGSGG
jgi:hypothetical protein